MLAWLYYLLIDAMMINLEVSTLDNSDKYRVFSEEERLPVSEQREVEILLCWRKLPSRKWTLEIYMEFKVVTNIRPVGLD